VIAHWLLTGLPLLLISPLLAILLSLELNLSGVVATLALGTPVLSLLGAVGSR
jgi:heme exporter protein B